MRCLRIVSSLMIFCVCVFGFGTSLYGQDLACCGQACSPPPPGPGGDHPDETFAVDSGNPPIAPVFTSDPHAIVLLQGNSENLRSLLSYVKKSVSLADIDTPSTGLLSSANTLLIPSGGLYGMEKSAFFKAALEEFVKGGGTLIVFAQQHGYEFSILPVPQETDGTFKQMSGYGWTEDQACFTNAAYIDNWHQMLAGQSRSTPTLNVDGYFTIYPTNATVLLRRTANSQPAMLMYEYGLGRVVVTSLYSDYAFGHSQASSEEIALVRDMISWAGAPDQLPEVLPGEPVTVSLSVTNFTETDASSVKLYIYTPGKNKVVSEEVSATNVPSGQTATIPVSWTSVWNSPLGIYHVEYELLDAQGNIIQPKAQTDSGHFAVGNPQIAAYRPNSTYQMWVTTSADHVTQGSDVTFTIHIKNNTATDLADAQIGIGSHEARREGGQWWVYRETLQGVNVNAGQTIEVPWTFSIDKSQSVYFGLFRADQNPETYFVGGGLARTERGVWVIRPSVSIDVQADQTLYARGDTVNLTIDLQNLKKATYTTTLEVRVLDALNVSIYNTELDVDLPAEGTSTENVSFTVPLTGQFGFCTVLAEAYDAGGRKIGSDNTSFELPRIFLSIIPLMPLSFSNNNDISFQVENKGVVMVSSSTLSVSLEDPGGVEIWNNQVQISPLQPGQSTTADFSMPISSITFGDLKLLYSLTYEGEINSGENIIPNKAMIMSTLNKSSYRLRETANLTLDLTNTGKFNIDNVTVTASVPDAGFTDTSTISFTAAQTIQLTYAIAIPETMTAGQHNVSITLMLPSGSAIANSLQITIPESALKIRYTDSGTLAAGDMINVAVENIGGVDTEYATEKLYLIDNRRIELYQGNISETILAGETKPLIAFQIPSQAAQGFYLLGIQIKNNANSQITSLFQILNIVGTAATLNTVTDKERYLNTESINSITSVTNGQFEIEDGSLEVAVRSTTGGEAGAFSRFLPLQWTVFNGNHGIAVGGDGSVYVTDTYNGFVQKFDADGNLISTLGSSGTGDGQFMDPSCVALGPDGSIYVADGGNDRIQKFDSSGNFITKWGSSGTGDGQFYETSGIAVGADGFVYVADALQHRIQKFDSSGTFITKWGSSGSGEGQFRYIYGIAIGPNGFVYVSDNQNHRIQKFDSSGTFITKWGSSGTGDGQFRYPYGIAIGSEGSIYVTDRYNHRIQKFDSSGTFITKWGSSGTGDGQFSWPRGIAVGIDGSIYVSDIGNGSVQKFNADGDFIAKWGSYGSSNGQFEEPFDVAVGPDGSVYVVDKENDSVQRFNANGDFITKWGSTGSGDGQFEAPYGVAVGPDGCVYVLDTYYSRVQKFDANGGFITKWGSNGSGDGQFRYPYGIAVGPDGSVYVVELYNNRIQKFDSSGNFLRKWGSYGSGDGQFDEPYGVAVGPDGSVYVSEPYNRRIQKFNADGDFITKWGSIGSGDGQFEAPYGIAVGPDGSVYVSDIHYSRIQKFNVDGNFIAKWGSYGSGNGQFDGPYGVAVGPDGSVYVADTYNYRIQRMIPTTSSAETIFETTVPINQLAVTTEDYITPIGILNTVGKLYLQAELQNSLGQTIAKSEYPFYVIQGNTVLSFNTDRKAYKPGETITITGQVENLASVNATGLTLTLNSQLSGQSLQVIYTETFNLPANSSHPFTTTATAGSAGTYTLTGKVTQGSSTLIETKDRYEVAEPMVTVTVSAPEVVGNEPFDINVEMENEGKVEAAITLQSSIDDQQHSITLPVGETRLIKYSTQITEDTEYTFTFTGDLDEMITTTVFYGLGAAIQIGDGSAVLGIYPEGLVEVPIAVTNTGQLDGNITVDYSLQPSALTQSETYFIPQGASVTDTIHYDLTEGDYQLTASSSQTEATATASFSVTKLNKAELTVSVGLQSSGLLPVTVNVTNRGYSSIAGVTQLSVLDAQDNRVWSGVEAVSSLSPLESQPVTFNINPWSIPAADYTVKAEFIDSGGQLIGEHLSSVTVQGPVFQITQLPPYQTFTVAQEATFLFTVTNRGNLEGAFDLYFRALDTDFSQTEWLSPGEETSIIFSFTLPDDLEEKDYFADYEVKSAQQSIGKGQVKYHVRGIDLDVIATLDKQYYQEGDTAQLTLSVINQSTQLPTLNLSARANYSEYEDQQAFALDGSQSILFDIPLVKITGEKLFFGVYSESGRSIYLNSLYIHKEGDMLNITTDKQVYAPGESMSVTVSDLTGTASGTLTLSGPDYKETFTFSGAATKSFTLPSIMRAGTYYIEAELQTQTDLIAASHPFDVAGILVQVKEATLDKANYASIDMVTLSLTLESNQNLTAVLKAWFVDPQRTYSPVEESVIVLSSSDTLVVRNQYLLTAAESGIYRLIYGIYIPVDTEQLLLTSGAETFDVGSAVLYELSTDKEDYPTDTEPAIATVTAYGTVDASLELQLDGLTILSQTISFSSTVTLDLDLGTVNPGPHTLKAILTAGGLKSTKETSFTYAMDLFDKDRDGMPNDWETAYGLDPEDPSDAFLDLDGDGLTNIEEYLEGTDPDDPDTDNDGMPDGWEVAFGLDPLADDASGDKDGDGYSNLVEYQGGSNPNDPASIPKPPEIEVTPGDGWSSSGPQGGSFSPDTKLYSIKNIGSSTLNWAATKTQSWVTLSGTGGTLEAGQWTTITVQINAGANALQPGDYSDTVSFTNTTNHIGDTTRPLNLTVTTDYSVAIDQIYYQDNSGREISYDFSSGVMDQDHIIPIPPSAVISRPPSEANTTYLWEPIPQLWQPSFEPEHVNLGNGFYQITIPQATVDETSGLCSLGGIGTDQLLQPTEWQFSARINRFGNCSETKHYYTATIGADSLEDTVLQPWMGATWLTTGTYNGTLYDNGLFIEAGIKNIWEWSVKEGQGLILTGQDPESTPIELKIDITNSGQTLSAYYRLDSEDWQLATSYTLPPGLGTIHGFDRVYPYVELKTGHVPPPCPGEVTLVSPSGTVTDTSPTYTWNADPSASWYLLSVNDSTGNRIQQWYSASACLCASGKGSCSVTPIVELAPGAGQWWVQTYNNTGYGPWSLGMSFTVSPPGAATLVSPSGPTTDTTPTYTWDAVSGATRYQLYVNDSIGNRIQQRYPAADLGCPDGTGTCSITPTLDVAGSCQWWVQACNSAGCGPWSLAGSFTAPIPPVPAAATPGSPSGETTDTTPTYTWDAVPWATWYQLYVNDSTSNKIQEWYPAADLGCADGSATCSVTPPPIELILGPCQWWIQTYNRVGLGPWSSGKSFTFQPPPSAVTQIWPTGTIMDTTPAYKWTAVFGATWYQLYVSDSTGNKIQKWYRASEVGCGVGTGTCTVKPTTALAPGAGQWWVQPYNSGGFGPWSLPGMSFNVSSPRQATLVSPSETINNPTPTYTWNAVPYSTWYRLWVNDVTGNKIQKWYSATDAGCACGTDTCSVTPSIPLSAGAGQWWIQTYNSIGYGPWSAPKSFTVSP